jgi:hypothetical protein
MADPYALLGTILTLYTWGGISILLYSLFAIARFFERKSSRQSLYQFFLLPIAFFMGSALRYASAGDFMGDPLADLGRVIGGTAVIGLGYFLLHLMTGGR